MEMISIFKKGNQSDGKMFGETARCMLLLLKNDEWTFTHNVAKFVLLFVFSEVGCWHCMAKLRKCLHSRGLTLKRANKVI